MAEVFINYRRDDGDAVADLIALYLSERFGQEHVFKASRSISPGTEYRSALSKAVRDCEVLLAVMGPDWPHSDQLRDPDDWVRNEILEAFATGKCVIPVLNGRTTDRLRAADLPQELARLAYLQSRRFDTHNSQADLEQIGQTVTDLVPSLKAVDQTAHMPADHVTTASTATNVSGTVVQGGKIGDVTNISDTHAPTQTGKNNTQFNLLIGRLKAIQPRLQSIELLRKLADRFVSPPGFESAVAALTEPGTVILDGPPGAGRTAAATMILFASWSRSGRLHELEPQDPGEETSLYLNPDAIGPADRVWVDLSDADPQLWSEIQRELPTLHVRVLECHARLVIIQPHGERLRSDFHDLLRSVGTTSPLVVFHHLLRSEGLLNGEDPALPKFLADESSMAAIRQFVDDISKAKNQLGGGGSLADWIGRAIERASPREEDVRKALNKAQGASQRAVLLSTAMLHGAHADVIDQAATTLLVSLHGKSDPALERSPLGDRLSEIDAKPDTEGHVRFSRHGYDLAVRTFFWRHFPELHGAIADLVHTALDSKELTGDQAENLACGFTEQCLEYRYQNFWKELVEYLTEGSTDLTRMSAAAAVLQRGLSDKKSARTFRQQIYRWSRSHPNIPDSLAAVLVAACDEMSYTNPDEAIVRLHHVARRNQRVGARDALAALARSDPLLLSLMLSRLTRRSSEDTRTRRIDAHIFLNIADAALFTTSWSTSKPLITQTQVASQLTAGWALAFSQLDYEEWASSAHEWLRHAAKDDVDRATLLDALVTGADQRADLLSKLFGLAHRAAFPDALSRLLLKKITATQGVELS